jgi:hypothetical protein
MPITNMKQYSAEYYRDFVEWCFSILGRKCVKCGSTENLEMDHVDPKTKLFTITSRMAPKHRKAIIEELKKCQTLCSGCHAQKTGLEHSIAFKKDRDQCHGTLSQYWRYKCRCDDCRKVYREYRRKREEKNGVVKIREPYKKAVCGTNSMYRNGCHCDLCKKAHRIASKEMRDKKKTAHGQDGNATACYAAQPTG